MYQPQRQAAGEYYRQLAGGVLPRRGGGHRLGRQRGGEPVLCRQTPLGTGLLASPAWWRGPTPPTARSGTPPSPCCSPGRLVSYLFSPGENRDLWKLPQPPPGATTCFGSCSWAGRRAACEGFYPGAGDRLAAGAGDKLLTARAVEEIHRGLLDFAQEWTELEKRLGLCLPISGRDAYAPMLEMLARGKRPLPPGTGGAAG